MYRLFNQIWYSKRWRPIAYGLLPCAWLFYCIVYMRRWLYRWGFKKTTIFPVPVIIVGNLSVGGAGKTPLVIWLAQYLQSQGYRPGIVIRGFRGEAKCWPQAVDRYSNPRQVGEEAVLLARHSNCPVVAAPDRTEAVRSLLKGHHCNVVLSDDGLQHYALGRDIEIVVVDGLRRFGNGFCLPAGPLREPSSRLRAADFIVCHGEHDNGQAGDFSMRLVPGEVCSVATPTRRLSIAACQSYTWHAVAGIGHPERFFLQLEELGLVIQRHSYPDHHHFVQSDMQFPGEAPIMMTEKDAVKCRSFANERHWYLPVNAQLSEDFGPALLNRLSHLNHGG